MSTGAAAATLGLTPYGVRRLLDDGVIVRVRRGVVAGACVLERADGDPRASHEIALRALLATYPDAVGSHESAGLVLGLPLLDVPAFPVVTRPRGAWRGGEIGRVRIAPLPGHHRCVAAGLATTSVARTVVDIARTAPFRAAAVVGDAAVRGGCGTSTLLATLEECAAWSDIGKARSAIGFLDGRAESPLESVSRAIMHERGLPPPEPQKIITLGSRTTYRVDFYWEKARLVGEADGLEKYDNDPSALRAEKVRQEHLERAGCRVERWTFREMLVETDETLARILRWL